MNLKIKNKIDTRNMNSSEDTKQRVLQLVKEFNSDSKSKSKKAKKELIKICEPIIKRVYEIITEFDDDLPEDFGFPYDYLSSRGSIDAFCGIEGNMLRFHYSDGCWWDYVEASFKMPLEWLDEDAPEKIFKKCKEILLNKKEIEINRLEEKIESLREEIVELKNR